MQNEVFVATSSEQQFNACAAWYAASHGQHRIGSCALFVFADMGLDVATQMLEQAGKRVREEDYTNVVFLQGSAEVLPFEDASFDLVTSRHAPHRCCNAP